MVWILGGTKMGQLGRFWWWHSMWIHWRVHIATIKEYKIYNITPKGMEHVPWLCGKCCECTYPDNHQKKGSPHLKVVCLPDFSVMIWCNGVAKQLQKTEVSEHSEWLPLKERSTGVPGTIGAAGHHKRRITERLAVALYLNELLSWKV